MRRETLASTADIVKFYDDQADQSITAALIALTALFLTFFAASLRSRMRSVESLSTLIMVGGALFAVMRSPDATAAAPPPPADPVAS